MCLQLLCNSWFLRSWNSNSSLIPYPSKQERCIGHTSDYTCRGSVLSAQPKSGNPPFQSTQKAILQIEVHKKSQKYPTHKPPLHFCLRYLDLFVTLMNTVLEVQHKLSVSFVPTHYSSCSTGSQEMCGWTPSTLFHQQIQASLSTSQPTFLQRCPAAVENAPQKNLLKQMIFSLNN